MRYVSRRIKQRIEIMERFSDDEANDGCGKHAESLFSHMFEKNQFTILARHTNRFAGRVWTQSDKNLDFIIQKDAINYGVEVKNTFDYMEHNEFQEKVDMCQFLGLTPMFPLRCPSPLQFAIMREVGGLALKFKTRIFPPGFQRLVTEMWNNFRLPVHVWDRIPPNIETNFSNFHQRNIS
ncbi:MAG: hypothetical protein HW414_1037 [Dehalococcoidia bacterium]|nr:hypothetical protein [Dehalococcoidia bacterium]